MPQNSECQQCPLHAAASTVCVWGRYRSGDVDAEGAAGLTGTYGSVMVVGEAPGADEDVLGVPFIGRSGVLLKSALAQVGITEYYVTNLVKCFPNGTPTSSHVAACKPYLADELHTVRPRAILALGNTAWHYFGEGSITEHAGREIWREDLNAWVVPALHPAAILRSPERSKAWLLDLARFAAVARGDRVERPPVTVHVVEDPLAFGATFLERNEPMTYDFETAMLPWWHRDFYPVSIAFSWSGTESWVVPLGQDPAQDAAFFKSVRTYMTSPRPKSAWNMLFDDLVWFRLAGYLPYCTFDPMVGVHLLDENQPKGLKWQGRAQLGWPNWDIDLKAKSSHDQAVYQYNGYDTAATWLLRERLRDALAQEPRLATYLVRLEMPKLRALERMIAHGVYVDQPAVGRKIRIAEYLLARARRKVPVENPNSTAQLRTWLYDTLKLTPPKTTPKGVPSTDEETIKRLARQHPEIRPILEVRRWQKTLSTYLVPLKTSFETSIDGRLHPEYRSTSVETGRLASPFHTTPRSLFIRSVYTAPTGWTLVQADYAQIEARLAAWKACGMPAEYDPSAARTMLSAWLGGLDVYCETAAEILHKHPQDVDRDKANPNNERQIMGKVPTLAMLYRISPKGLREYVWREFEIEWSMHQAERAWAGFYARWPEFARWHAREERILQTLGYSESPLGRRRRLPAAQLANERQAHEAVNAGINQPIQSVASDITQTSMILFDRHIQALHGEPPFAVVGNVHDALLFEVRDSALEQTLPFIKRVMEYAPHAVRKLGLTLPESLIQVELTVGPWGAGKEWKGV